MKNILRALAALLMALWCAPAQAQLAQNIRFVTSAPAGSCKAGVQFRYNLMTNNIYGCYDADNDGNGTWTLMGSSSVGALLASNNLSDVADATTARTNLGLKKFSCTGTPVTCSFYDDTPTTGRSIFSIRNGASQTWRPFEVLNNGGTVIAGVEPDGSINQYTSGARSAAFYQNRVTLGVSGKTCWSNNADLDAGSADTCLVRNSAGKVEIQDNAGATRDLKVRSLEMGGAGPTLFSLVCGTAPGTPASDVGNLYCESDQLKFKDDAGTVYTLGAASGVAGAYDATAWNGNTDAPTKDAVRDKIESLSVGGGFSVPTFLLSAWMAIENGGSANPLYNISGPCSYTNRVAPTISFPGSANTYSSQYCNVYVGGVDGDDGWGPMNGSSPIPYSAYAAAGRANSGGDIYIGWVGQKSATNLGLSGYNDDFIGVRWLSSGSKWQCVVRSGGSDSGTPADLTGGADTSLHYFTIDNNSGSANTARCSIDGGSTVSVTSPTIPTKTAWKFVIGTPSTSTDFNASFIQFKLN